MSYEQANIKNNEDTFIRPYVVKGKHLILGKDNPGTLTQITFFISFIIISIFSLWNAISYVILSFPAYLKENKQVDVNAILELRGRELNFDGQTFITLSQETFLFSTISWSIALIMCIFLWRRKKWATFIIIGCVLFYVGLILLKLGTTFFMEDITTFDKCSLVLLLVLIVIHHFIVFSRVEIEEEA